LIDKAHLPNSESKFLFYLLNAKIFLESSRHEMVRNLPVAGHAPNLTIGADGNCNACASHGTRREIDWTARARLFQQVVEHAKSRGVGYDCLIPVSGGKDSTWQVVTCLEAGLKPLAVTWKTPGARRSGPPISPIWSGSASTISTTRSVPRSRSAS